MTLSDTNMCQVDMLSFTYQCTHLSGRFCSILATLGYNPAHNTALTSFMLSEFTLAAGCFGSEEGTNPVS